MCPITVKRIQVKLLATSLLWWMELVALVYSCFHVASVCILVYPVKGQHDCIMQLSYSIFTLNFLNFLTSGSCGSKQIKYRSVLSSLLVYSVIFLSVPYPITCFFTLYFCQRQSIPYCLLLSLSHSIFLPLISHIVLPWYSLLVSALEYVCRGPWYDCVFEGA